MRLTRRNSRRLVSYLKYALACASIIYDERIREAIDRRINLTGRLSYKYIFIHIIDRRVPSGGGYAANDSNGH